MLHIKLFSPDLSDGERRFLETLSPAFTELEETAEDTLYVGGAQRLLSEDRLQELSQIGDLMQVLERRVALLSMLQDALEEPSVYLRIGEENLSARAALGERRGGQLRACRRATSAP